MITTYIGNRQPTTCECELLIHSDPPKCLSWPDYFLAIALAALFWSIWRSHGSLMLKLLLVFKAQTMYDMPIHVNQGSRGREKTLNLKQVNATASGVRPAKLFCEQPDFYVNFADRYLSTENLYCTKWRQRAAGTILQLF